ncbi:MAG: hypothetical protein JWM02_3352 [Frankiales bacterium]|nr:hypothetical protein [Frankiales bacterium]
MAGYDPSFSLWCPPELTAAAVPLRRVGELLRALSDDRRGLEHFTDSSPSAEVRRAFVEFVERWELVLWSVGGTARSLSDELRRAAEDYVGSEADLERRLLLAYGGGRR